MGVAGCSTAPAVRAPDDTAPPAETSPAETPAPPPSEAARAQVPAEIPAADLATQYLFRAQYLGPQQEDGSFRLILWLESLRRFRLQAVDPIGRVAWNLDADDSQVLWIDHRGQRVCRYGESIELPGLAMGAFPAAALPSLLLGVIPVPPVVRPKVHQQDGVRHLQWRDAEGRAWTATLRNGDLLRWALWAGGRSGEEAGGEPVAQLRRQEPWWILLDRRQDLEVRWRQVLREPLEDLPPAPEIPPEYGSEGCREEI